MPYRSILVTGASGFAGQHLLPLLRDAFPAATVTATSADVVDAGDMTTMIRKTRPDACVHLAAIAAIPAARANPDRAWQVNLLGSLNLARAILADSPDCILLAVSSADCYGATFQAGNPVDESGLLAPTNTYAATKAAADLALGSMVFDGLKVIRVRPFNHTGPGQSDDFVVPAFARQVARIAHGLQPPEISVGDLSAQRDFLDVRDVCAGYVACLKRAADLGPGSVVNIASGVPRRVGDILTALIARAGIAAAVKTDAMRLRPSEIPIAIGRADLARTRLGWAPVIPWAQTLGDVLDDWHHRVAVDPTA